MNKKNIKEKIKNYWNRLPCNIKYSNAAPMSMKFFNEISKKRYFCQSHIPEFANFSKFKNKNVLEIGCGIGTDAHEFIKNESNYYGIDLSKESIEIAKKRAHIFGYNNKKANFFVGDAENLSKIKELKEIKFDLIYSFGVLHHTPNIKKCFDNIYKSANFKTEIKIMLYAKNSYKNFLVEEKIGTMRYEAQKGCPLLKKIDNVDLKKILSNKFKILSKKQDFIFPYKVPEYKKHKYVKLKYFQYMPSSIFKLIEKKLGEHLLLSLKKLN